MSDGAQWLQAAGGSHSRKQHSACLARPRPLPWPCPLATLASWLFVNQRGLIPHLQHLHWLFSAWKAPLPHVHPLVRLPSFPQMSPQPAFSGHPPPTALAPLLPHSSQLSPCGLRPAAEELALTTEGLPAHGGCWAPAE